MRTAIWMTTLLTLTGCLTSTGRRSANLIDHAADGIIALEAPKPTNHSQPRDFGGFEFSVPPGRLWEHREAGRPETPRMLVQYVNMQPKTGRTSVVLLESSRLSEDETQAEAIIRKVIETNKAEHTQATRYDILRWVTQADPRLGPNGQTYRVTLRDRGAPGAPAEGLVIEVRGLFFTLPLLMGGVRLVNLDYSERGRPADLADFEVRAQAVFERLKVDPPAS